ncbi:putative glycosyltransferase EpsD [Ylistrum balloti]|uniref:putative glycosyltransferase EpsD n=1 Tax=Ylistrum balloti TaxID=509963 RepID=UPI002905DFCF|nr:putative glycosyltransferase EpsD [Ylistrum balloti]
MTIRCLQIITRLHSGGAEEAVLKLVQVLYKHSIICDIATGSIQNGGALQKNQLPSQCTLHHIPSLKRKIQALSDIQAYRSLRSLIQKQKYDIVHTHTAKAGIVGRYAAHKASVPVVHTVHGLSFGYPPLTIIQMIFRAFERWAGTFTNKMIFVSHACKQYYLQQKVARPQQSSVIYVGQDLEPYRRVATASYEQRMFARKTLGLHVDSSEIVLACIARIVKGKNLETLFTILSRVVRRHTHLTLLLFGDGEKKYKKDLEYLAKKLGIDKYVRFMGFYSDIWKILPAIDIHCFTSLSEGLPLAVLQCSAAGIPTVCFPFHSTEEIIRNGESGYICPKNDIDAYTHALCTLIENKDMRKEFGKAAVQCARGTKNTNWEVDTYSTQTIRVYNDVLQSSARY